MGDSFIIAIDFGTAYSGYAFNITPRNQKTEPCVRYWGEKSARETPKTPTCILFDKYKQFISFGYEAKEAYVSRMGTEAKDKLFFESFKMSLYKRKLSLDMKIKAANGKEMKALQVFTEALKFLKEDALTTIAQHTAGRQFTAADFTWVLTVPAIWEESAKQFMREAATQAGIVTKGKEDKLVIALEPEAASVYCKKLPSDGFIAENLGDGKLDQSPGTQYIVVDCGGGTIDITFHEVLEEGNLKELHKASGNDLGGQTVDRKFKQFLREIFTGVWDDYEKKFPNEVQKIMYDFTLFKKHEDDVEIPCPFNLGKLAEKKKKIEKYFKKVHGATWEDGSIKISKEKLKEFFEESLEGITRCLTEILKKDFKIKYILLVGGYADSKILRNHITDKFGDDYTILCPFRPQEVIMKGAVEFGRNKGVVASRKNPFTYGIGIFQRFDKFRHREDKKFTNKDGVWCRDIFMKLVDVGEDVCWNETREHTLYPVEAAQKAMSFSFYRTKKKHVAYIDEPDTEEIGSFVVESPDTTLGLSREIRLKIKFGFTEMTATGTDRESGSSQTIRINFMRN
ncbi:heat shock 70 kDa protein 12A-like isoform X4 [Xiphophorus hellerii]|uniref:heat shock 70 kDa protein 12A-like isoform X4 n=1 Tax=Xiphophorus hellerii TaxID=8084 RepID=UPI0013B3B363|nr:heat shock 70 kDa protein 12A-like isoform X4 [Xiphophorus hellerii]